LISPSPQPASRRRSKWPLLAIIAIPLGLAVIATVAWNRSAPRAVVSSDGGPAAPGPRLDLDTLLPVLTKDERAVVEMQVEPRHRLLYAWGFAVARKPNAPPSAVDPFFDELEIQNGRRELLAPADVNHADYCLANVAVFALRGDGGADRTRRSAAEARRWATSKDDAIRLNCAAILSLLASKSPDTLSREDRAALDTLLKNDWVRTELETRLQTLSASYGTGL